MKRIFILLICFCNSYTFSQDFSVSELVNFLDFNSDEIDTKIVNKGYVPYVTKFASDTNCVFFYEYKSTTLKSNDICTYNCIYDGNKTNISFRTRDDNSYRVLKEQIVNYGFKFKETVSISKGKMLFYTLSKNNKNYELTLASRTYEGFNLYEITINRE
jgi:hypothetical protein